MRGAARGVARPIDRLAELDPAAEVVPGLVEL